VHVNDFDYHLPDELIAQEPLADRSGSRMLVLHRKEQRWEDRLFRDLPEYLSAGDCLVLNNSRVLPCRLPGHRVGFTGKVEVLLLRSTPADPRVWTALVHPGRKMRTGERVEFAPGFTGEILGRGERGERMIRLDSEQPVLEAIEQHGHMPLPPYIERPDTAEDRERYQTVYAQVPGSAAAPTAGLHFTPEVLERCRAAGADVAYVTLHVGLGTFQPLSSEQVETAHLHSEWYQVPEETAARVEKAARVVAVGTTSVRTLESAAKTGALSGDTDLFIYPGFEYKRVGAMLTNFHLPKSSLVMLVAAFAGHEFVLEAYRHAVEMRYRFFSYGDCMLIV
jgi:S-adenosylmethionine:tRNA ribosyltransferase-isomerase